MLEEWNKAETLDSVNVSVFFLEEQPYSSDVSNAIMAAPAPTQNDQPKRKSWPLSKDIPAFFSFDDLMPYTATAIPMLKKAVINQTSNKTRVVATVALATQCQGGNKQGYQAYCQTDRHQTLRCMM